MTAPTTVSGWGRYRPALVSALIATDVTTLAGELLPTHDLIARGLGRSYGDAAQRDHGSVIITTECDEVSWIDSAAGIVRVDAGVSIGALIDRFAPKGWFVPVTPGTRHVTVGGAIAADIHGKNHHLAGSFGAYVRNLRLRLATDEVVSVGPDADGDLFWATIGGMGLTGIIIDAEIELTPISSTMVEVETTRLTSLPELVDQMFRSDADHEFSVAWVDLLHGSRSVLTQGSFAAAAAVDGAAGRYARPQTPNVALPRVPLPRVAVTPGVRMFNELWWRKAPPEATVSHESITAFFHPLDAIRDWNRVYGGTGFVQWQCVVPDDAVDTLLQICDALGDLPSFFTVLKRLGPANPAPLSFPMAGWTLAVDLPATTKTLTALPALDRAVAGCGGRIYLAKDARLEREVFDAMYSRLDEFKAVRQRVDPGGRFASDLSVRLGL